jgi:hypothetical protein
MDLGTQDMMRTESGVSGQIHLTTAIRLTQIIGQGMTLAGIHETNVTIETGYRGRMTGEFYFYDELHAVLRLYISLDIERLELVRWSGFFWCS